MEADRRLRPARAEDRTAIAGFTRQTFDWGDYVADAFPAWLEDPDGLVLVVTDEDDVAIGVGRTVMLSTREAWLHAARVHPDHRRQGVGAALNEGGVAWARTRGAQVARLAVETWNRAAQSQVGKLGYRPVAEWVSAEKDLRSELEPTTNGGRRVPGEERLVPGRAAEADLAWMAWSSSELATAGRRLLARGWHFRQATIDDLTGAARKRALWQSPSGWVVASLDDDGDMFVPWLATTDLDAYRLLRALIDLADGMHTEGLQVMAPQVDWLSASFERAGFELRPFTVFALAL